MVEIEKSLKARRWRHSSKSVAWTIFGKKILTTEKRW